MTCVSHTAIKWWSQGLNKGMSDSFARAIHPHDSEKGREPKAGSLRMVAFDGSVEEEPRKNTGEERPGKWEWKQEKVTWHHRTEKGVGRYCTEVEYKKSRNTSSWIWHFLKLINLFNFWPHGLWFPDQGFNLGPRQWERRVLTTGPPGNSLDLAFWAWL